MAIRGDIKSGGGYGNDLRSLHSAGGGRRPVKVWNAARTIRKALVVATYEEFQRKGREKVGLSPSEPVRVVLEGDGTQVIPIRFFLCKCYFFKLVSAENGISHLSLHFRLMMANTFKHYLKIRSSFSYGPESYGALQGLTPLDQVRHRI